MNKGLITHSIYRKLPWLVLGFIVILITVILLPIILRGEIREGNIALGIFLMIALGFISAIVDSMFLHRQGRFIDVASKPVSLFEQLMVKISINVSFSLVWMLALMLISQVMGYDLCDLFSAMIPLSMVIVFVAVISSLLSGTTLFASVLTWFNFALPVILVGIIHSILILVNTEVKALNVGDMMERVTNSWIPLERLYFAIYADDFHLFSYIIHILLALGALTLIVWFLSRIRYHENIGETIVFKGYKQAVTMMLATMAGYIFILTVDNDILLTSSLAFALLYALVYYCIMMVHYRSFRVPKTIFKGLLGYLFAFFALVLMIVQIAEVVL